MLMTKLKIAMAVFFGVAVSAGTGDALGYLQAIEPTPAKQQVGPNNEVEDKHAERQDNEKKESRVSSSSREGAKKDKANLSGSWKGTSFTYLLPPAKPAVPFPSFATKLQQDEIRKAKWEITEDKITIHFKPLSVSNNAITGEVVESSNDEVREMKDKVDLTKKPKPIDLTPYVFPYNALPPGVKPPPGFVLPKGTCKGIFELEGDTLKICYGQPDTKRLTEFKAAERPLFLFVLTRELLKKDEKSNEGKKN